MCIEDSQLAAESVPTSGAAISTFSATSQGHYITDLLSTPQSASFLEHPPTFLCTTVFPPLFCWTLKQEKFLFRSFSPTQPGFQASVRPLGSFLPWFPHCRTHCPMDSSKPSVLCPTWLGQLPFYVTSFQHELHYFYEVKDTAGRCRSESWTLVILTTQKWQNISI